MNLKVINTGSKGNCYILSNEHEALIIEAGVNSKKIMKAIDFEVSNVKACLVTHEHKDHSLAAEVLTTKGIDVYSTPGTFQALELNTYRAKKIKTETTYKAGNFKFRAYKVEHDANEPVCFEIYHADIGKIVFITDTSKCKYIFENVDHFLIEANFDEKALFDKDNEDPLFLTDRISKNHLSIQRAMTYVKNHDYKRLKNIILIHLSNRNSDMFTFEQMFYNKLGLHTLIAQNGESYNLKENSQIPF